MNILDRGWQFLQGLRQLAQRSAWDWRRCPHCGQTETWRHGTYTRHPWTLAGRQAVVVQRHWCVPCRRTYSEQSALLVRGSWYAREVHRQALDLWLHGGSSLRRTAEWLRSTLGHQERWRRWRPLDPDPAAADRCWLSASSVQRWLDQAGVRAERTLPDQLGGVPSVGQLATDGLWARLRGGVRRVLLLLTDCVTGVVYPPVVVDDEATAAPWARLFARAQTAGVDLDAVRGVVSDGAAGLGGYLGAALWWVNHQRCVFHLWRNLRGELTRQATAAATGLVGAAAQAVQRRVRRDLVALVRRVLDARDTVAAQAALLDLAAHQYGAGLATVLAEHLDAALVYQIPYNAGLGRASPEWCWRDFRLRLSHGRNHGTDVRLERAALVWAIYHNFEPAQERSERKRHYRRPGLSPLALAGVPPGEVSYLDALAV